MLRKFFRCQAEFSQWWNPLDLHPNVNFRNLFEKKSSYSDSQLDFQMVSFYRNLENFFWKHFWSTSINVINQSVFWRTVILLISCNLDQLLNICFCKKRFRGWMWTNFKFSCFLVPNVNWTRTFRTWHEHLEGRIQTLHSVSFSKYFHDKNYIHVFGFCFATGSS